jgi:hypothetical protein
MKATWSRVTLLALLSCLFALLAISISVAPTSAKLGPEPPGVGLGRNGPVSPSAVQAFGYDLLKQSTSLWADGTGDMVQELTLQNQDMTNWNSLTWYFDWPAGTYSNIRAWDDAGPLVTTISQSGTRVYVTVTFRNVVPLYASYHYFLAISIPGMASGSGNDWRASWYTYPGSPVAHYVEDVIFPANSTIQDISPVQTSRNLNTLEWVYWYTTSDWQDNIDVGYALSSTISVPLYRQGDQPWGSEIYDNYGPTETSQTIKKWGCLLSSAAMVLDYAGQRAQPAVHTDPETLNNWLKVTAGGFSGHGIVHCSIQGYASAQHISLYFRSLAMRNDGVLDTYLSTGNPVILGVNPVLDTDTQKLEPSHWVVATGKTTVNGQATYSINDPVWGAGTLIDHSSNSYYEMALYASTLSDQRDVCVSGHSPIQMVATDQLGRRTGYDPTTSTFLNEIPGAYYHLDRIAAYGDPGTGEFLESKSLIVPGPVDGIYALTIFGTGQGSYTVDTIASNRIGALSVQSFSGVATQGSVDQQQVNYNSFRGLVPPSYLPLLGK